MFQLGAPQVRRTPLGSNYDHSRTRPGMDAIANAFTWERFLVLWGLLAPPIAWIITRRWERANQRATWDHEFLRWKDQLQLEDARTDRERERQQLTAVKSSMRDVYTRFMAGASAVRVATELPFEDERTAALEKAMPDLVLSFQQLLLLASNDCATKAVDLWNHVVKLASEGRANGAPKELSEHVRTARRAFLIEARADLEAPMDRTADPGLTIRPVLEIGGFTIADAG